jgi:hypothetical protein
MNILNRRQMLQSGLISSGLLILGAKSALAQVADPEAPAEAKIMVVIGRNHGHALDLNLVQALQLLRETAPRLPSVPEPLPVADPSQPPVPVKPPQPISTPALIDIQGSSGHPHSLELQHQELIDLFVKGTIRKASSTDAGHAHMVEINLTIV